MDYAVSPSLTLHIEHWIQQRFPLVHGRLQPLQYEAGNFRVHPGHIGTLTQPDGNYACGDGRISFGGNNCADGNLGTATGYFCDPQLGCSNRLVAEDLVEEHAWQLNQEFRLASNFSGPLNFSVGGNFMHYETEENYFVFFNTLTMYNAKDIDDLQRIGIRLIPARCNV